MWVQTISRDGDNNCKGGDVKSCPRVVGTSLPAGQRRLSTQDNSPSTSVIEMEITGLLEVGVSTLKVSN